MPWVIGALGALALLVSSCGGGSPHAAAGHKVVNHVRTAPATFDPQATTTTSTSAPKANPTTTVPTRPAPPPAPTTTTTVPFPPGCDWTHFAANVTTDHPTYSAGQTVGITLVLENTGPACTVNATGYACPRVDVDNSSGTLVWSTAAPISTGCASTFTGPTVVPASWSQTSTYSWTQVTCTPGGAASCPGPAVPAGEYQVVGMSSGGSSQFSGPAVGITITP